MPRVTVGIEAFRACYRRAAAGMVELLLPADLQHRSRLVARGGLHTETFRKTQPLPEGPHVLII